MNPSKMALRLVYNSRRLMEAHSLLTVLEVRGDGCAHSLFVVVLYSLGLSTLEARGGDLCFFNCRLLKKAQLRVNIWVTNE